MKIKNKLMNQFTSLLVCCVALTALAISSDQIRRTAHANPLTETNCASLPGFVFKPADTSLAFAVSSTAEASAPEPASAMAAPPQPTYGAANVDGNIGEWDLTNDFFANMYRAGKTDKEIESKLYLRYDCATKTLYALVLVVPGVTIITSPNNNDDHFIKIGNNNKLVDANDGDNGSPPDFRFVPFGSFTIGWEASANLNNPLDIDNLNVHTQVNHDGSQTSAVADRAIPLVLNCTTPTPCAITGPDHVCAGDRNKDYSGPSGNNLSYKWEIQGNATIDGENDNRTVRVDVGASGAFTLKLTVTDTQTKNSTTCTKIVTVNPQPAANAGPDQAKCKDPDGVTTFTLIGSVTPGSETPLWTLVSDTGSAQATIVSPNNSTTDVNVTGAGTVTLRLRSKVTCGTDTDEVTLRVNDSPNCSITGSNTVCAGSTGNTYSGLGGSNLSYAWTIAGNGSINGANNQQNVNVTAGASGSFTLTLTISNTQTGCSSVCAKTVTVGSGPDTTITVADAVCAGSTGNTASVPNAGQGATYTWNITNGTIISGQGTNSITWSAGSNTPVTLEVQITDGAQCSARGSKQVKINPLPTCAIRGADSVCSGSTGNTYSGPSGANLSYAWTISGNGSISGASNQQNVNVTAGASGSFTLTLTVTDTQTGCGSVCSKTVTVASGPDTTITVVDAVCAGSTGNTASVPSAGQGATYNWTITNGTITTGQGTNSITWAAGATGPVTLQVQVTNGAQCSARGSKQVKINPLPTCAIRGADAVCAGSTGNTYSGPSGANLSYSWSISGNGSINGANNAQNVNVNAGASGSFTLTLTVTDTQTGCGSVCSKTVTVGSGPDTTITVAEAVCAGSTGNTASVPSAGQGATYTWNITNGTITNGQGTNSITWTAGATGPVTLQVQITTGAQCSGRGSKQIRVNPLPECSINGPNTVCASSTGATYSGPAGANLSYAWSIAGNGSINGAGNQQNVNVTAGASGSFTLTLTVTNTQTGCSSVCTKTASIGSGTNTTTITAPNSVCADSEANTASVPSAGQGATYAWTITNGTIASGQGTNSITWNAGSNSPVTLSILVTSGSGCPARASKQVTVSPEPSAAAGPDQTKCQDADGTTSFTLTGSVTAGSQTPFWSAVGTTGSAAATIVSPNNQTTTVNVTGVGAVTLRLRSKTACGEAADDVTLTVTSAPGATITAPNSVCASSTGNIASTPSAGQGATYDWTITNGTITAGQGTSSIAWTAGSVGVSTLNVVVSVGGGCGASASKSVTVTSCDTENKGPGFPYPDSSEASDQKAGSILIYNFYTSSVSNPNAQDTRINITNISQMKSVAVHFFFVNGENCSVADSFLCLTENQTASFLASEFDPGVSGYLVAVAVDSQTGCPISFNCLIGDEYIKLSSGHSANLGAEAFSALFAGRLPGCDVNSVTANLVFDGTSGYNRVPRMLALSNIPSPADGNNMLLILNRIGGDLTGGGLSPLTSLFGILYNDNEDPLSFGFSPGSCQFRATLSSSFPRTVPRLETHIPAGRSGWMRLWMGGSDGNRGILGAQINFNSGADAGAFNQGHNLHKLTLDTINTFTIPIIPPNCD